MGAVTYLVFFRHCRTHVPTVCYFVLCQDPPDQHSLHVHSKDTNEVNSIKWLLYLLYRLRMRFG